jgi:hypothetical protein
MPPFANGYLVSLLQTQESPCISIYLPTERTYPASQQSPIRYRNLVDQAEESLRMKYTGAQVRKLMEPFRAVAEDLVFWTHRVDGLAILGSPTRFEVLDLHRPVPERVIVAESFHLKPLLRIAQSADRFHVLCLQRDAARLYEGNRDVLHPIEAPGVPLTMTAAQREAVGVQSKEQVLSGKSAGKPSPTSRGPSAPPGPLATRGDGKLGPRRLGARIAPYRAAAGCGCSRRAPGGLPRRQLQSAPAPHGHREEPCFPVGR